MASTVVMNPARYERRCAELAEQHGQPLCIQFLDTASRWASPVRVCDLPSFEDYVGWCAAAGLWDEARAAQARAWGKVDPAEAEALRKTAVSLWESLYALLEHGIAAGRITADDLGELNGLLNDPRLRRRLDVARDDVANRWDVSDDFDAPLLHVALSAADVLIDGSWRHIVRCASEDCGWLVLDTSRNHSRRYCSASTCGNRARAHRFYHRRKATH